MKNETRDDLASTARLTPATLQELKDNGFRYVQVKGFTLDKRLDYMEPHYFVLVPMKELPADPGKKGIYEPIDSKMLTDWANSPNEGAKVFIATGQNKAHD